MAISDDEELEEEITIRVKRQSKQKSGFEVEKRKDGHYYSKYYSYVFIC